MADYRAALRDHMAKIAPDLDRLDRECEQASKRRDDPAALARLRTMRVLLASGLFDAEFYEATYGDTGGSTVAALAHYVSCGEAAGRQPNPVFSPRHYRQHAMGGAPADCNALQHYIEIGERAGRTPSRSFDPHRYLEANPQIAQGVDRPLFHFLKLGQAAGLALRPMAPSGSASGSASGAAPNAAGKSPGERLSFVLPIALAETGRPGQDLERLDLLLKSFLRYFDRRSLGNFLIVTRPCDMPQVRASAARYLAGSSLPFEIIDENRICPEFAADPDTTHPWPQPNKGWQRQQLLKLACHRHMRSPFYMALDCDVVFVRHFAASDLIRDGRSIVNVQMDRDYRAVWVPEVARDAIAVHEARHNDSARVLQLPRRLANYFYGETPVVLNVNVVKELEKRLATLNTGNWREYLLSQLPWTEYNLYFTFAEHADILDKYHRRGGFDSVLCMSDSLWLPPESYLDGRSLASWNIAGAAASEGVAVVVQSYLGYPVAAVRRKVTELLGPLSQG